MNGVHDMGGMHGMGPVEIERNEPVFHSKWEARVFALTVAAAFLRRWNIDMGRHSRERMPPAEYLAATYYERWLFGLQKLLVEEGLVTAGELETAHAESKVDDARTLRAADVANYLRHRVRTRVEADVRPRFRPGDRVIARNTHPTGHTRLPRYARGRRGVIDRDHGVFIFPDTNAMSRNRKPQHLYTVRFAARELWGSDASARDSVYVNLWDDHLDPA
ncbi:MAG: nitrile hydratase subunit beta [Betaproteobacteria bacterium]|nr:nitrile hydratase subunit beta [Gammaproteobacteria bacterium]MDH3437865.1 nitrile hydratase subunit beta [Betaproteobacteria bacterium]